MAIQTHLTMTSTKPSYFRTSPFSLVATEDSSTCWAGRQQIRAQLKKICKSWIRRQDSTIDLMWANLGAGKTHALLHLRHLLTSELPLGQPKPIFVFVELAQDLRSFLDLYSLVVDALPLEVLMTTALKYEKQISVQMQRAARAYLAGGPAAREIVEEWIIGRRPHLRDLRATTGISARIESDVEAEHVLTELLTIAALDQRRVVLLVDEFQRLAQLPQKTRATLLSHLRALVSRRATYFSVVLAVGTRLEQTALQLLPAELKTIMGMRPVVTLPAMSRDDAREFVLERLAWFRYPDYTGPPDAPFGPLILDRTLAFLAEKVQLTLTPRLILQTLGLISDALEDSEGAFGEVELVALLEQCRWEE